MPEVMIPLIGDAEGNGATRRRSSTAWPRKSSREKDQKVDYMVGTMIELPRAALVADEIAKEAEFFSFGTNDLTQTTFGFSRDDVNKFLPTYLAEGILKQDPFAVLDQRRRRPVGEDGHRARPQDAPEPEGRHLRRARRRTIVGRVLPPGRPELRFLLTVPRADGAVGSSTSQFGREKRRGSGADEVAVAGNQ